MMNSKIMKLKEKSAELLLSATTVHGVPNIFRTSNRIVFLMWLSCFLTSTCIGFYYSVEAILDYLQYPTLTTLDIINEPNSQFPTVSFCFALPLEFSLNESITRLRFDRVDFNKSDFSSYFEKFIDPEYGNCFRFNSGRNVHNQTYNILNSTTRGMSYSLRMDFYLDKKNEYDVVDIMIAIHNSSLPPLEIRNGGVFWSSTGNTIWFQVERIFKEMLDAPYSSCLKDVNSFQLNKTLVDLIQNLSPNRKHTHKDCLLYCSYLNALEESKCKCNSTLENFSKKLSKKPV